eukprot:g82633.t1
MSGAAKRRKQRAKKQAEEAAKATAQAPSSLHPPSNKTSLEPPSEEASLQADDGWTVVGRGGGGAKDKGTGEGLKAKTPAARQAQPPTAQTAQPAQTGVQDGGPGLQITHHKRPVKKFVYNPNQNPLCFVCQQRHDFDACPLAQK